uniref:Uncharacterized protein n=1 Tax=Arundo donax TaxID=35708 RepID=A0A0A9GZ23_ARUDO
MVFTYLILLFTMTTTSLGFISIKSGWVPTMLKQHRRSFL